MVLTAAALSSCVAVDAAFLVGTLVSQAVHLTLHAEEDVPYVEGQRVYYVKQVQQVPLWSDPCRYDSVLVQYRRDWDEVDASGSVRKAAPEKFAGFGVIVYKEYCPGKEPRDILSTGTDYRMWGTGPGDDVIRKGGRTDAIDYASKSEEKREKWMPQVLAVIHAEAATNHAARDFLKTVPAATMAALMTGKFPEKKAASSPPSPPKADVQ
ncbi:MAG: hypothetical protein KUL86_14235 [Castellaniella sp.]|nr:hypothetical protein [Castellaniella sp.]